MRASIPPLLVLALTAACGGGDAEALRSRLSGQWEWTGSSGGIAGDRREPTPEEPAFILELRSDGTATFRVADTITQVRQYRLGEESSIYHGRDMPALYFEDDHLAHIIELAEDDRFLTLSENVYDGFSQSYRRIEGS